MVPYVVIPMVPEVPQELTTNTGPSCPHVVDPPQLHSFTLWPTREMRFTKERVAWAAAVPLTASWKALFYCEQVRSWRISVI